MTADDRVRWQRVTELFARALERPSNGRHAFLERECAGDAQLLADVLSLLGAHERASSSEFLERPAAALAPDLLDDDPAEFVGRRVGPYVIRAQIGRGGMGVVFKAEDTRLGRAVALKAVPRELAQNERLRERLRREARLAASLSHPAIATVYALEEAEAGELFIATEFVKGRNLRDELADGPVPRACLIPTACAIAGALAEAHARGIVHRDLKPENVIRRDDGQIKVLDFGLAQAVNPSGPTMARLTVTGSVVGTPGYMAPEQLRGSSADARVDVFSFGVLLYELATGQHPFGGGDPASLIAAMLEGRTPLPSAPMVSPEIDAIIRRCLRIRPEERFATGGELLAALTSAGDAALRGPSEGRPALWWWEFHQVAVSVFHSAMLVALWFARGLFPAPWGAVLFYVALVAETITVTMRLHLRFSARHSRDLLAAQRTRVARPIVGLDLLYGAVLLVFALRGAHLDVPAAPLLVTAALVSLLSLLVIEPATTRAAFNP